MEQVDANARHSSTETPIIVNLVTLDATTALAAQLLVMLALQMPSSLVA
jgi:hypothetical protein